MNGSIKMVKVVIFPTGDRDAVEIGDLCTKARGTIVDSVRYLVRAGQRLIEKKQSLEYGEWMLWIKENTDVLGFNHWTATRLMRASEKYVVNHIFNETEASKISKEIWGNTAKVERSPHEKIARKRTYPRKTTNEQLSAAANHYYNTDATLEDAQKQAGLKSIQTMKIAVAKHQGRAELLDELDVDPDTLALSAKAKLEAAKRMMERKLEAAHAARMYQIEEEVRQRVLDDNKEYLASLNELEAKARSNERLWREMINDHKLPFTPTEFKAILMCLHPDGERTPSKLNEAFLLFNSRKLQLSGEK